MDFWSLIFIIFCVIGGGIVLTFILAILYAIFVKLADIYETWRPTTPTESQKGIEKIRDAEEDMIGKKIPPGNEVVVFGNLMHELQEYRDGLKPLKTTYNGE